jgi:small subunit ribosomal protein S16
MSVRLRLTRVGSKKNPIWRVVVADQRSPRDGRFIETIGRYNPQTSPSTIAIDEERLQHWIERGAQPSGAVKQLLKAQAKAGGPQVTEAEPEQVASTEPVAEAAADAGSESAGEAAPAAADASAGEPAPAAADEPDPAAEEAEAEPAAEPAPEPESTRAASSDEGEASPTPSDS